MLRGHNAELSPTERARQLRGSRAGTGAPPFLHPHADEHVLGQVSYCLSAPAPTWLLRFSRARDRCVTGTPSTRFSRSEEGCLANCVDRFLDTSLFMVKKIEEQRAQHGQLS